jgi:predicted nucleotidyltransferase
MKKKLQSVHPLEIQEGYRKVQQYFFDYPTKEFSLNDLCKILNISKTTANVVVQELLKEGFLKREIIGKLWRISCEQQHIYNISRKIPYHLGLLYESNLLAVIHDTIPGVRSIILFGSYRKGDDYENSDVDIASEIISNEPPSIIELGIIPQLGYRKNVSVHVHVFSRNNISLNLFANIANGIVLEGFLEVRP